MISLIRNWIGLWWCDQGIHNTGTERHGYCRRPGCGVWVSDEVA